MSNLKLLSICAYLTDTDVDWRTADHTATKMVKVLKGDPIKGYFDYEVAGKVRRFTQENAHEFAARIPPALARTILLSHDEAATIVPIPNSHVTSPSTDNFRTLALAEAIAKQSGGRFSVSPALVFKEAQQKSREGGPRDPAHFEQAYDVVADVKGPIILLDDVCTGGGHLIAAHWRLHRDQSPVVLACTFGRTTKQQLKNPIGILEENLNVGRSA